MMINDVYYQSLKFDRMRILKKNKSRVNNLKCLKLVGQIHKKNKYNYIGLSNKKIAKDKDIIIIIDNSNLVLDNVKEINVFNYYLDNYEENKSFFKKNKFKKNYTRIKNKIILETYQKIIKVYSYCKKNNIKVKDIYVTNYQKNDNNNYMLEELDVLLRCYQMEKDERIEFIYDYMCDYLDSEFDEFNLCDFIGNKCVSRRDLECHNCKNPVVYGCCYTKGRVCPYLDKDHCTIKCLPCKFFTCRYLEKRGIKYRPWHYLIIRLFMSYRDMDILDNCLYTEREIILTKLKKKKLGLMKEKLVVGYNN